MVEVTSTLAPQKEAVELVIVIPLASTANQKVRKQACLDTWIKEFMALPPEQCRVFFIESDPSLYFPKLDGDTLKVPCQDGYYYRIQEKFQLCVRWLLDHFEFKRIFKCDTDTIIFPDRLLKMLELYDNCAFFGYQYWPFDEVPGFPCGGAGYSLNHRAAEVFAKGEIGQYGPEEQDVAAILYRNANITLEGVPFLESGDNLHQDLEKWLNQGHLASIHYVYEDAMRDIYTRYKNGQFPYFDEVRGYVRHPDWSDVTHFYSAGWVGRKKTGKIEGTWQYNQHQEIEIHWTDWPMEKWKLSEDGMSAKGDNQGKSSSIEFYFPMSNLARRRREEMAILTA